MPHDWFEKPGHTELLASPEWSECEDRIRAFEDAWRQAPTPDINSYLCASGPVRLALLTELALLDLQFRLTAGDPIRVETYFERYPELSADRHAPIELIEAEHEIRQRSGQHVTWEEYGKRFPDYVEELVERSRAGANLARPPRAKGDAPGWPAVAGYEIVGEIARGGMGVVYKAFEPSLGRHVALKFLPGEVAQEPDRLERFLREARTASGLNHPYICTVHALGQYATRPFIVLEFIDGETLRAQIGRRPAVERAARWIAQTAQALAAAHAAGVVHRDIKPENIMLRGDGYVKVLDFGLARRPPSLARTGAEDLADTDPGTFFGTVAYMSPEQVRGETADSASDIFSLGIVFYEVATGQHPFPADSALAMLHAITTTQPARPSRLCPEIPAAVDQLIEAMLHKDPRLRPAALEVDQALATLATSTTPTVAPPRFIVRRERELAALHTALKRAESGQGALVCVAGEPGIGKSALVQDFLESERSVAQNNLFGCDGAIPRRMRDFAGNPIALSVRLVSN